MLVARVAPRVLLVVAAQVLVASWVAVLVLVRVLVSRIRSRVGVSMWRLGLRMRMRMACLRVM